MASGLTPIYSLPYPLDSDPVNVASDVQDLAEAVENVVVAKANLTSPAFSGLPTAPTASVDTNTTQIATTAFVIGQGYISSSSAASIYAPIESPNLTGMPVAPTASVDTNTTQIATTEFVINQEYVKASSASVTYARIDGVTFTGAVSGLPPTASAHFTTKEYVDVASIASKSASHTLEISDLGKVIEFDSSLDIDLVIPTNSSVEFPVGSTIDVVQIGNGKITLVPFDGTVMIQSKNSLLSTDGQYSGVSLYKRGTNTWIAIGDLA